MWLRKAALQGHRDALIAIGERIPAAVIADPTSAAPLFQRAADAGCARARKVLADWILAGLDVGVPAEQALELIEAAARDGDAGRSSGSPIAWSTARGALPPRPGALLVRASRASRIVRGAGGHWPRSIGEPDGETPRTG